MVISFNIEHKNKVLNPFPFLLNVTERYPLSAVFRNPDLIEGICDQLSGRGYDKVDMVKWRVNFIAWDINTGYQKMYSFRLKGIKEWRNVWI